MQPYITANDFLAIANQSIDPNYDFSSALIKVEEEYLMWAKLTIPVLHQSTILSNIRYTFNEIESLCKGIQLLSEFPEKTKQCIGKYPEKLSAYINQEAACFKQKQSAL